MIPLTYDDPNSKQVDIYDPMGFQDNIPANVSFMDQCYFIQFINYMVKSGGTGLNIAATALTVLVALNSTGVFKKYLKK